VFVKVEERALARALRRHHGLAIKEIARRLDVSVSSVSVWVRDIALTPEQRAVLDARNPVRNGQLHGSATASARRREARLAAQAHGRELARGADSLHAEGCMLYWAEGAKARNQVMLANADPDLLGVFVRFLRRCYGVEDERIRLSVNCFTDNGLTVGEIESWWLARLELPATCLRTAIVNRASSASRRLKGNVLPYGTARLRVSSTFLVQSIYGAIQEYAGIDRPEWLDL
jgi:hypothetical protein